MSSISSRQWLLAKKPTELPVLEGADATFELSSKKISGLQEDEALLKVLYLSNDPAQRLWIDPHINPDRLYTTPVAVGETMASYAIARVIESRSAALPIDTLVSAPTGWSEYTVLPAAVCMPITTVNGLQPTESLNIFGLAGITAYYGLVDIVKAGSKDAIVVSAAGGAVGAMAIQIAKNVLHCRRVIGIAGTDEKCKWVESLGADACLNYRSPTFENDLRKATAGFVEVYFDNVGGRTLDLMLTLLQKDGRVAACGAISEYNSVSSGIKNWYHVIAMRLRLLGFVVTDAIPTGRWDEIVRELMEHYEAGRIRTTKESLTVVDAVFEDIPKIWLRLFSGQSVGKLLTRLVQT